jgi:hypothetical protein
MRLQRDTTDFLFDKALQTELYASSLLSRSRKRASDLRSWFQMWSLGVAQKTETLKTQHPEVSFRAKVFGSGVEIVHRGDFRAYIAFCNTYSLANIQILSLENSEELVEETIHFAEEACQAIEYQIKLDILEISHVSTALEGARSVISLMKEWSEEYGKRRTSKEPGGRFIDFRLWLKFLHAFHVKTGHEPR